MASPRTGQAGALLANLPQVPPGGTCPGTPDPSGPWCIVVGMKDTALNLAGFLATLAALCLFVDALTAWRGWAPVPWTVPAFSLLALELVAARIRYRLAADDTDPDPGDLPPASFTSPDSAKH